MYLLSVPGVSSGYFNKIEQTSYLGKLPASSLEILYQNGDIMVKMTSTSNIKFCDYRIFKLTNVSKPVFNCIMT